MVSVSSVTSCARLDERGAWIEASRELDAPVVSARLTEAGDLALVTSASPSDSPGAGGLAPRVVLVSAANLAERGSSAFAAWGRAWIAGEVADRLVIESPADGLRLFDTRGEDAPKLERVIPAARFTGVRAGELFYLRAAGVSYVQEPASLNRLRPE